MRLPPIRNKVIRGKTLWMDFVHLNNTTLENCRLVYFGLGDITLTDAKLLDCTWHFAGPAGRGAVVLQQLIKMGLKPPTV